MSKLLLSSGSFWGWNQSRQLMTSKWHDRSLGNVTLLVFHAATVNMLHSDPWLDLITPLGVHLPYFCLSKMHLPSSPSSSSQHCWLLRGFITLQAICCPQWINLMNCLGWFTSNKLDSLSFLFAKECKVHTLSDGTIKLPTSREMQGVGKIGLYLSETVPLLVLACMQEIFVRW